MGVKIFFSGLTLILKVTNAGWDEAGEWRGAWWEGGDHLLHKVSVRGVDLLLHKVSVPGVDILLHKVSVPSVDILLHKVSVPGDDILLHKVRS